jgi:hypothetical protein
MRRIVVGTVAAGLACAGAAQAAEPVEGVWASNTTSTGRVLVESTGSNTFKGTIVGGTDPSTCTADADGFVYPVGAVPWQLSGSGTHYDGQDEYVNSSCQPIGEAHTTWDVSVSGSDYSMRQCVDQPNGNPPSCTTLVRVAAPKPPPTFTTAIKPPSTHRCASRRSFVIHIHDRSNDPVIGATVSVNGVTRVSAKGFPLTAPVRLVGLPKGTVKVRIVATTAAGRTLNGTRTYHTCVPGHRR